MKKYEAWTEQGWEKEGMTWVIVARERLPGACEVGMFLVDVWCLGVKDAFVAEMPRGELEEMLDEQIPADRREAIEPACARKLIEGAAAYAQGFGFLPARDYRKARKVLGGLDAKACTREITFGRDGKPCFVAGPDDDQVRINRVLAILTARLGPDGFNTVYPELGNESEADEDGEAMGAFYDFLGSEHCRDKGPGIYEADGFLTGVLLLPEMALPSAFIPAFWGGDERTPVFPDPVTAAEFSRGMVAVQNDIIARFEDDDFEPELPDAREQIHAQAAAEFCRGFLRALEMRPAILQNLREGSKTAGAIAALERISRPGDPTDQPVEADRVGIRTRNLRGEIGDAIGCLDGNLRESGASANTPNA